MAGFNMNEHFGDETPNAVRFTKTPRGDAPKGVRSAWEKVVVPVAANEKGDELALVAGTEWGELGVENSSDLLDVDIYQAIAALVSSGEQNAATYWAANAVNSGMIFNKLSFGTDEVEQIVLPEEEVLSIQSRGQLIQSALSMFAFHGEEGVNELQNLLEFLQHVTTSANSY